MMSGGIATHAPYTVFPAVASRSIRVVTMPDITAIVFITAHGDSTVRPRLIERGAVECLSKPFSEVALLDALSAALPKG